MQIARTINYHVDIDEITPQGEQFGGMQGEHESTVLVFHLTDLLIDIVYREDYSGSIFCSLQATDGAGGYHEYELLLTQSSLSFLIPSSITRAGGIANFCLVFRETKTQNDEIINSKILYSFPFKLRFKDTLTVGTPSQQEFLEDGASILEGAKKYAQDALEYRNETKDLIKNANDILPPLKETTEKANSIYESLNYQTSQTEGLLGSLENLIAEGQEFKTGLNTSITNGRQVGNALLRENSYAKTRIETLESLLGNTDTVLEQLNNIDEALDRIIALQQHFIGGDN